MASLKSGGADAHQHVERVIHLLAREPRLYRRAFVVLVQPYCLHQCSSPSGPWVSTSCGTGQRRDIQWQRPRSRRPKES